MAALADRLIGSLVAPVPKNSSQFRAKNSRKYDSTDGGDLVNLGMANQPARRCSRLAFPGARRYSLDA
jgi:hypothetical protein